MLTNDQKQILSKTASEKYHLDIKPSQIAHLILDNFECILDLGEQYNYVKGRVENFRNFPLRMDFDLPMGSSERKSFTTYLQQHGNEIDLSFNCQLSSVSHTVKINTLTITSSEYQQMAVREKLLGSASSVYVNRYSKYI
jgi:hypothetical protein